MIAFILIALALSPVAAFADSSTDAALGLAAFAVFNQIPLTLTLFDQQVTDFDRPAAAISPALVLRISEF